MKRIVRRMVIKSLLLLLLVLGSLRSFSQAQELEQLALDIEKLAQFKKILTDLKTAYDVLYGGYTAIKNISEGNFSLHKTFLDGLMAVSPAVQKYRKIADIISLQTQLVREYKSAKTRFSGSNWFSVTEIEYISNVYENLFDGSLRDLDALLDVITANKLRMSDDERLKAIDKVYESMQDKMVFLRHFNAGTSILDIQRTREQSDVDVMRRLHNVK